MSFELKDKYDLNDLKELVTALRSENGCPWDREQTHKSIRRDFLEEAYEAVEAIDDEDTVHLCEELGDVLFQVFFHADMEEDAGRFDLNDVADGICKKMVFRHPHVFGNENYATAQEVLDIWDDLKKTEKEFKTKTEVLKAVAKALPSTWRAEKIQKKAENAGAKMPDAEKSAENLKALADNLTSLDKEGQAQTIGKMFFELVNIARLSGVDAEDALNMTSDAYIDEFEEAEKNGLVR